MLLLLGETVEDSLQFPDSVLEHRVLVVQTSELLTKLSLELGNV